MADFLAVVQVQSKDSRSRPESELNRREREELQREIRESERSRKNVEGSDDEEKEAEEKDAEEREQPRTRRDGETEPARSREAAEGREARPPRPETPARGEADRDGAFGRSGNFNGPVYDGQPRRAFERRDMPGADSQPPNKDQRGESQYVRPRLSPEQLLQELGRRRELYPPPRDNLERPFDELDRLMQSPTVKRLLELMAENVELKAQIKVQQVESEARERIHQLQNDIAKDMLERRERELDQLRAECERLERAMRSTSESSPATTEAELQAEALKTGL